MYYTREDVIITKEQAEKVGLKVGDLVFYNDTVNACLCEANDDFGYYSIQDINWYGNLPFYVNGRWWDCVIKKKEPEKKFIPFNLSDPEVRKSLRFKWIKNKYGSEWCIIDFSSSEDNGDNVWRAGCATAEELLNDYIFVDTGKPVGREIEE